MPNKSLFASVNQVYPDLERVINNRRWQRRSAPFPHFAAMQVFKPWFYDRLEATFNQLLSQGFNSSAHTVARRMSNYDAYSLNIEPFYAGPLNIFVSPSWFQMLATLTGVAATPHINAVMHHHSTGSSNGRVHTDLNPAWFLDRECAEPVQLPQHDVCNYKTGTVTKGGVKAREVMRAIAMLFYLSNGTWERGDGGETGLYSSRLDPVERPLALLPPMNNSLLVFECTPCSFHSFLSNRRSARNSVIIWLHREKSDVEARWGAQTIECWPRAKQSLGE